MTKPPSLPTISAHALLWVIDDIVFCHATERRYTGKQLKEAGQPRTIRTFLAFLELVSDNGELADKSIKRNPKKAQAQLRDRFKKACRQRDWWSDALDCHFGRTEISREELDELLESLPPVQCLEGKGRANLVRGLRELHHVLQKGIDRKWIKNRLNELSSRRGAERRIVAMGAEKTMAPAEKPCEPAVTEAATGRETGTHAEMTRREKQGTVSTVTRADGPYADGPELSKPHLERQEQFVLDFDENDEPVEIVVASFDPPLRTLDNAQVLRIANTLKVLAEAPAGALARLGASFDQSQDRFVWGPEGTDDRTIVVALFDPPLPTLSSSQLTRLANTIRRLADAPVIGSGRLRSASFVPR